MGTSSEAAVVREIQILGDQETCFALAGDPYVRIRAATKLFLDNCIHVVPQTFQAGHQRYW